MCGTESVKNFASWYKSYAIVGLLSIPTYKKCYAGAMFKFQRTAARHKKVLYHVEIFCLSYFPIPVFFLLTGQVPCHSHFLIILSALRAKPCLWWNKQKKPHTVTMVHACHGHYRRLWSIHTRSPQWCVFTGSWTTPPMTGAIHIEWGGNPIQYNQPWQFEMENTLIWGAAGHGLYHSLWAIRAHSAQQCMLTRS